MAHAGRTKRRYYLRVAGVAQFAEANPAAVELLASER
jgi:hypothetical protein